MSITDELSKYIESWRDTPHLLEDLDAGDVDAIFADIERFAVRIEAEHEKAMSRAGQLLADAESDRNCYHANWLDCKQKVLQHSITIDELDAKIECLEDDLSRCIELPKDADGEYIHMGDVMESRAGSDLFPQFEVRAMRYDGDKWEVIDRLGDRYEPSGLRHYHAPTIEDMLREFGDWYAHVKGGCDEDGIIAEYAAKLRLADGKE